MMTGRSFKDEMKYQWKYGGMHIKLIAVNLIVYVFIKVLLSIGQLSVTGGGENPMEWIVREIFMLHGDIIGFISHPWGIFTSIFAHFEFMHFAFNMLFFYFISRFFLQYFSNQRMLYTYILGGIMGGLFQILAYSIFPALRGSPSYVIGASGAVNAVFMAAAFYRPMAEVRLFGILRLKMIYIAVAFFLMDLLQMSAEDNVAHFAHLGGAIFGFWSLYKIGEKSNVITIAQNYVNVLKKWLNEGKKPTMKVHRNTQSSYQNPQHQTDEEYNLQKKKRQEEINKILDKISKSGYDSLTKREKKILFDQSNKP